MTPNYEVRVEVPQGSEAWALVVKEIPRSAALDSAWVVVTPRRASVSAYFVGQKPDGTPHKRTSVQSITIATNLGDPAGFISSAVDQPWADALSSLLPDVLHD